MTDTIEKVYFTLKESAQDIGITECCLRDRAKRFGIIDKENRKRFKIMFNRKQVEKLKLIHLMITVNGLKDWKIKELLKTV